MSGRPEDAAPRFETFGCRLNAYETEAMRALAERAGLSGAVVVNTCAVTAEAVRQARQSIRRIRRADPQARVIVTGCAAQTEPETFAAMEEVDLVIGNLEKMRSGTWEEIAGAGGAGRSSGERPAPEVATTLATPLATPSGSSPMRPPFDPRFSEKIRVDDILSATETSGHLIDGFGTRSRAHVQVQNGCDHRCTEVSVADRMSSTRIFSEKRGS
ncbi:MAG: hypothetical protein AAFW46_18315, partial [Pseudomonadota bacterium]